MIKIRNLKKLGGCLFFSVWYLALPLRVYAQEISLSISPPIVEATIHPGKSVIQPYEIKNDSGIDLYLTAKIFEFEPADQWGNIRLNKLETKKPFFSLVSTGFSLGETFKLPASGKKQLKLQFAIPENEIEGDHYFTLLIEQSTAGEFIPDTENTNFIKLGSNILLTISGKDNPEKQGKIIKFTSQPKIADMFGKVHFNTIIENTGQSFFKTEGKIEIINLANKKTVKTLNFRPDNVLAGYSRNLVCLEKDISSACTFSSLMPGVFRATISFSPDNTGEKQSISSLFLILPIRICFGTLILIIVFFIAKKMRKRN